MAWCAPRTAAVLWHPAGGASTSMRSVLVVRLGERRVGVAAVACGDADAGVGVHPLPGDEDRSGEGGADGGGQVGRVGAWGEDDELVAAGSGQQPTGRDSPLQSLRDGV